MNREQMLFRDVIWNLIIECLVEWSGKKYEDKSELSSLKKCMLFEKLLLSFCWLLYY